MTHSSAISTDLPDHDSLYLHPWGHPDECELLRQLAVPFLASVLENSFSCMHRSNSTRWLSPIPLLEKRNATANGAELHEFPIPRVCALLAHLDEMPTNLHTA